MLGRSNFYTKKAEDEMNEEEELDSFEKRGEVFSYETLRAQITGEIDMSIRNIINECESNDENILNWVNVLLKSIEKLFSLGLRDRAIFGHTTFWDVLEKVNECLPGSEEMVRRVRKLQKSPLGRGRCLLRIALNQQLLPDIVMSFSYHKTLLTTFYSDGCLFNQPEYMDIISQNLYQLNTCKLKPIVFQDRALDSPEYWDFLESKHPETVKDLSKKVPVDEDSPKESVPRHFLVYQKIVDTVKRDIQAIILSKEKYGNVISRDVPAVPSLLTSLDMLLKHGLKDTLFGTPSYWPYVKNIQHILPNSQNVVEQIAKMKGSNDEKRALAFLRIALNNQTLGDYLATLTGESRLTDYFYEDFAILRNDEYSSIILTLLDNLSMLKFTLNIEDVEEAINTFELHALPATITLDSPTTQFLPFPSPAIDETSSPSGSSPNPKKRVKRKPIRNIVISNGDGAKQNTDTLLTASESSSFERYKQIGSEHIKKMKQKRRSKTPIVVFEETPHTTTLSSGTDVSEILNLPKENLSQELQHIQEQDQTIPEKIIKGNETITKLKEKDELHEYSSKDEKQTSIKKKGLKNNGGKEGKEDNQTNHVYNEDKKEKEHLENNFEKIIEDNSKTTIAEKGLSCTLLSTGEKDKKDHFDKVKNEEYLLEEVEKKISTSVLHLEKNVSSSFDENQFDVVGKVDNISNTETEKKKIDNETESFENMETETKRHSNVGSPIHFLITEEKKDNEIEDLEIPKTEKRPSSVVLPIPISFTPSPEENKENEIEKENQIEPKKRPSSVVLPIPISFAPSPEKNKEKEIENENQVETEKTSPTVVLPIPISFAPSPEENKEKEIENENQVETEKRSPSVVLSIPISFAPSPEENKENEIEKENQMETEKRPSSVVLPVPISFAPSPEENKEKEIENENQVETEKRSPTAVIPIPISFAPSPEKNKEKEIENENQVETEKRPSVVLPIPISFAPSSEENKENEIEKENQIETEKRPSSVVLPVPISFAPSPEENKEKEIENENQAGTEKRSPTVVLPIPISFAPSPEKNKEKEIENENQVETEKRPSSVVLPFPISFAPSPKENKEKEIEKEKEGKVGVLQPDDIPFPLFLDTKQNNPEQPLKNPIENHVIYDDYNPSSYSPQINHTKGHSLNGFDTLSTSVKKLERQSPLILDIHKKVACRDDHCHGCNAPISLGIFGYAAYCYYTGHYFCKKCHKGDLSVIPARLLYFWDITKYTVAKTSLIDISSNMDVPIFNIKHTNPELYSTVPVLREVRGIRKQLYKIASYIQTCKHKKALLGLLTGRHYLLESVHIYSLHDLLEISTNQFSSMLYNVMEKYIIHVTQTCSVCRGKGYYCIYCNDEQALLFPFQFINTQACPGCRSLFHKNCSEKHHFTLDSCPKCLRIKNIKGKQTS